MISVLVPIDENTRATGGLDFVKKHNMDYVMPTNADGSIRTDLDATMFWEPTDCYPGDIFLFDAYAPHRSDMNISQHTRRNCYLTYNRLSKGHFHRQYWETKRAAFPPDVERDPNKDYSEGAKVFNVANPIK
jgi:ectoine hydroxylase-related dioxygenase (phytanoyl-CoA dioxygenase family)